MKIKRKEYEKQLDDKYWDGVKFGLNFALDNPTMAERYRNNIPVLRAMANKASEAMQNLAKGLSDVFRSL